MIPVTRGRWKFCGLECHEGEIAAEAAAIMEPKDIAALEQIRSG